jgi:hypothetical protein
MEKHNYWCDMNISSDVKFIDLSDTFGPSVYRELDINEIEPISLSSYKDLIKEQQKTKLPYILAIIQQVNGFLYPIDAMYIWRWTAQHDTNPLTTLQIRRIFFYSIENAKESFEYLGNTAYDDEKWDPLDALLNPEEPLDVKQERLAHIFEDQSGIRNKNPHLAFKYYKRAAETNKFNPIHHWNLAQCYTEGFGIDIDHKKYLKHLQQAADLGDTIARNELGEVLAEDREQRNNVSSKKRKRDEVETSETEKKPAKKRRK